MKNIDRKMFLNLTTDFNENTVFCPMGLEICLGFLYIASERETREKLQEVLGVSKLEQINNMIEIFSNDNILSKNLLLTNNINVNNAFITFCKEIIGLEYQDANKIINLTQWVDKWAFENTNGFINGFGHMDPVDALTFLNLIYFKGEWVNSFGTDNKRLFMAPNGDVDVDFMLLKKDGRNACYIAHDGPDVQYQGVQLAYKGNNMSMLCLMPIGNDNIYTWLSNFEDKTWNKLLCSKINASNGLEIHMPEFEIAQEHELNEAIKAIGLEFIFAHVDLSQLTNNNDIYVDRMRQKVKIKVDKIGTEAAALTEVNLRCFSATVTPDNIIFNRPFLYVVLDNKAEKAVFMGVVNDPTK